MANAYSAPNFNIDSADVTVADLTALKGGTPPATSDLIFVNSGYRVSVLDGETLNIKRITMGDASTGAVAAAKKTGACTIYGGATVNFLGDATNTNSGIKMSPTTPDATVSKGCNLTFDMSNGKDIVINNSVASLNTSYKWTINKAYGNILVVDGWNTGAARYAQVQCNNSFGHLFTTYYHNSTRQNTADIINNLLISAFGANSTFVFSMPAQTVDLLLTARNCIQATGSSSWSMRFIDALAANVPLGSGGGFDASGYSMTGSTDYGGVVMGPRGAFYTGQIRYNFSDIRPTTIPPTGLAFTDPGTGGELAATITNIASYANADELVFYNASGDAEVGRCSKAQYVANGNFALITGLTNATLYTIYAKATSDNNTFSAATATAQGTPTLAATDAAFLALEILRNVDPTEALVIKDTEYKIRGVDKLGSYYSASAGPDSIQGKLTLLIKLLINAEVIKEDPDNPGQYVIVNYDNDEETELRKCALKTLEGLDVTVDADEICIRERTTVTTDPVPLAGAIQTKLDLLTKAVFNKMANVEIPAGSGKYYRVIYDDNGRSRLAQNHLKTANGSEISSLKNRGDINIREASTV